ncbi:MAG: ABC transporter ATP-binding protein [Pirellulales bacterium]|nr:ABC transporter ATP-binding protein [Pirellulales bacterium]
MSQEDLHIEESDVASNHSALIEVDWLHINFGRQEILREIKLSIPRGQTLVVIGESGCGKTVLLKSIIGLVCPSEGHVRYDGRDLAKLTDAEMTRLRQNFGFVFQNAALFDSLTIGQNIAFPIKQHHLAPQDEIRDIVRKLLAEVGLSEDVAGKKPAQLSGGMRKRVGLARALAMDPEVILYDEPTTGLDPIMTDVIAELILRTKENEQITSVVVTHDMHAARKVADRIVMLYPLARVEENEEQVIFDGTPQELDACRDERVRQFVEGRAGERLTELSVKQQSETG